MKHISPVLLLAVIAIFLSTTAFQCGSAEMTTAKLAMQQKQWEKAEESLVKELSKNDKNEEAWFLLGQVRLELRRYLAANEAYTKALSLGNTHMTEIGTNRLSMWAALYNDGIATYNKGKDNPADYDSAVVKFKTASAIVPDSANTYYVLGLAQYAKKDFSGAVQSLQTALAKKPTYTDAARLLGQIYLSRAVEKRQAKDEAGARALYEQAAENFEIVYKADPKNADNIIALIEAYESANQSEKALKLTRDAVASDPNNMMYRYAYGVFLLKQDKFEESIEQFKKALEIEPNNPDATYNCGVAYLNWGVAMKGESDKKAEAERKAGKGIKDIKEDMSYKEKFKEGLPYLEKSTELRKDDALLWQQLARIYANLNMVDKSKVAFEKADAILKGK